MYKKNVVSFMLYVISILFIMASTNFFIDPGEIYYKKITKEKSASELPNKLFSSKHGVIQEGWNERLVKTIIARKSGNFDCVILGSSHVMQISNITNTGNIKKSCNKLLNLGVSGGSLEDMAIFSYLIFNSDRLPKAVYLSIDPWTLKFGMDRRFGEYNKFYTEINEILNKETNYERSIYAFHATSNLLNGEYFYRSILSIINGFNEKNGVSLKTFEYPEHAFEYEKGYEKTLTLQDGSHLYSSDWIKKHGGNNKFTLLN